MRITENQIRRIIRQVLTEGRRAKDWGTYVTYTSEDNDIPREDVEQMVSDYKSIVAMLNSRLTDSKFQGDLDKKYTKQEMDYLKIEEGQGDSYQGFIDWYMRFNSSPARDTYSSTAGQKWLHPNDVIDVVAAIAYEMDKPIMSEEEFGEEKVEEPKTRIQRAMDNAKQRRATRKQGREDRQDIKMGAQVDIAWLDKTWRESGAKTFTKWDRNDYLDFRKKLQRQLRKKSRYAQREIIASINKGELPGEAGTLTFKPSEVIAIEDV